ncbi:hypothetical protein CKF54_03975 [Psittacicella hinzii]|uniref:Uncharacterized protein n=1 Tax=Psittacicella hinzii TaxID=2028575 RepID=A0A3A1Y6F8_9GAMM|nr:hypothetical protein [Psittacicella hinzii]RIY32859.1 hypothetical protein CKF54_03975 [Psittacicella hinzii]
MNYFYRFALVMVLSLILMVFVFTFFALDRNLLLRALLHAYGFTVGAEQVVGFIQQNQLALPANWYAWLHYQEQERIAEFMVSLDVYQLLLWQRLKNFSLVIYLSIPFLFTLFYALKTRRQIQQEHVVYVSPLKKTVFVYLTAIVTWAWLLVYVLPMPVESYYLTIVYALVCLVAYKLRLIVQVSHQESIVTVN